MIGIIAGSVIGAIILIAIGVYVVIYLYRKRTGVIQDIDSPSTDTNPFKQPDTID